MLNEKDFIGRTAFHWACHDGHSKIAEMLIQKSAEFNIKLNDKDDDGKTAFQLVSNNGNSEIAEMLKEF